MAMEGSQTRRPIYYGAAGGILAAILVALLAGSRAFAPIDNQIYDYLLDVRAELDTDRDARERIVLVLIDEATQSELGIAWPWPRSWHGRVVEALQAAGARAIGFDMLFIDRTSEAEDQAFAEILGAYDNIVLGAKLEASDRSVAGGGAELQQLRMLLPIFRNEARWGLVNLPFDRDHVVRRFRPHFDAFEEPLYSFAMTIHELATGSYPVLDARTEHGIDFVGGGGAFRAISAADVISGAAIAVDPQLFHDKIVLVGVTLAEAKEFFATPLAKGDALCAGVEIHANVLASMLDGRYCRQVGRGPHVLVVLLIAGIAGYLAMFRSLQQVVIVYALTIAAVVTASVLLMVYRGLCFDMSYALVALPLTYMLAGLPARKPMVLHTRVGPYQLIRELGRGGMAVVYQARHPRTRELVALKQMLPRYAADEQALKRFLREMELLRQLDHPNIVSIIDAGEVSGQPYYAMEYISGKNLQEVLVEQYRMSPQEVRHTCEGVAHALYQAHQLGVVHRDLKPSNIMLTATALPKLTDFGIACKTDAPHLTQDGMLVGTPQYMSPEQCRGDEVSYASDIYSFGATLYHLLTGRPPFAWPEVSRIVRSHLDEEPPDITLLNPRVDAELAEMIMACLAKAPTGRPASMQVIAQVLHSGHGSTVIDGMAVGATTCVSSDTPAAWQREQTQAMQDPAADDAAEHTQRMPPPPEP